ncbi:MAG: riboflavin kinase, partial [Verrucomicrobiota bacterium]
HIDGIRHHGAGYQGPDATLFEAHLFDFSRDLYGRELEVALVHRIREDRNFPDESLLRKQIAEDIKAIRDYFQSSS